MEFHCQAGGDPTPRITWVKVDDKLDSARTSVTADNTLIISQIDSSDEGSTSALIHFGLRAAHKDLRRYFITCDIPLLICLVTLPAAVLIGLMIISTEVCLVTRSPLLIDAEITEDCI